MGAWRTAAGERPAPTTDVPRVDHRLLPHPRQQALLAAPDEVTAGHTVVVAPTGYGKTALLAHHARALEAAGAPVLWLTVHPDLTADQLWSTLAEGVQRVLPSADVPAPRPSPDGVTEAPAAERWAALAADLERLPRPLTLVLDDVDRTGGPPVLAALSALTQPAAVRVVWVARHEPPVGLARLRLQGLVHDVDATDLALRPDEVAAVLARSGVDPADPLEDRVAEVMERTGGWPAAVSLLGGAHRLEDWVGSDVLGALGAPEVDLLRRTSIVDDLPVDLAVELSGRQDAGAVLHGLHRRTGLLERLPGRIGTVYRVHPLLRGVLREQLRDEGAGRCAQDHAVAVAWFEAAGDPWHAVEHASAAADGKLWQRTLLAHGLGTVLAGGAAPLRRLLERRGAGGRTAVEVVHHALAALAMGDVGAADALLVHARSLRHGGAWAGRLEDLYRSLLLQRGRSVAGPLPGEVADVVAELADPARRELLDLDVALHVMVSLAGYASREGDHEAAYAHLVQARSLAELYGYGQLALQCRVGLAGVQLAREGLQSARAHAEPAVRAAARTGRTDAPELVFAHVVVAWSAHQQMDDEQARASAARALAALDGSVDETTATSVRACEAMIAFAGGERHTALLRLHQVVTGFAPGRTDRSVAAHTLPRALRMCLAQGEWTWAQECLELTDAILPGTGEAALAHALWARARHRGDLARRTVTDAGRPGTRCEVPDTRLALHLLRAVLLAEVGDAGGTHESLVHALAASRTDRSLRPFVEAAPSLLPHLVAAAGRVGELEAWRAQVTEVVRSRSGPGAASPETLGLTPREMAVLVDLPSLLPLSAIAESHHVSPNTLKTQVKAIYRKLGASSRHEAVTSARLLGLLPS
ncbi:AAA family ATPase [Jannaschia sp. R86511]|uniref:AAA family ATPase n=1 Tax=Jannaschia sp. R86511 TaxID=3093853 RepID=UPI0036D34B71